MLNNSKYTKTTVQTKINKRKSKQYNLLKLMIGDIKQTWNWKNNEIKTHIFGYPFSSIMFAGRIIERISCNDKEVKLIPSTYKIDDGSGSITVHYDPNKPWNKGKYEQNYLLHLTNLLLLLLHRTFIRCS